MNSAIPERKPVTEEISGVIERVTFHNDDSGFCVLRVKTKGHREETTVIGSLPSVTAGEWLVAEGCWIRDREHGLQFKASALKTVPPTTAEGIERYLGSGLVKGIGPILAKKLVLRFGAEVLAVIENRAAELQSVDGIGPKRRERIAHAWQEAKQVREIMLFLHSHGVSTSRAVRIFKTYGEQAIEQVRSNPYMIRRGQMPDMREADPGSDFHFVERDDPEKIVATLVKLVQERIPDRFHLDPLRDVQVLCPMNRGSLGVRELNTALQRALNPLRPGQPSVERFGWRFQMGDKVIQTENDYDKEVFNGDIGTVERIDTVEHQVVVRYDDRTVKYDFGELDEVAPAYAVTVHKSQGSEFPAVVIPLATQHYMLLQRNLIYTGITRGKKLVVLVGQKKAFGIAVRNDRPQRRYSGLLASLKGKRGTEGSAVESKAASQSRVVS